MKKNTTELEELLNKYKKVIDAYGWSSYTLRALEQLVPILDHLREAGIKSMIDLGCGYKILTCIIAEYLRADKVYGIDVDEDRLKLPLPCSVNVIKADITQPLNVHIKEKLDLITSFGVIEHNMDWDALFNNINALSQKGSYLLLSAPNLGSWVNRMALLFGFQPRDLEISSKKLYHVLPYFKAHAPAGHVKLATYGAIRELLEDNGFHILKVISLYTKDHMIANIIDKILEFRPSLARRYAILAQKYL